MGKPKDKATECREIAEGCIEIAKRISAKADRDYMVAMANRYLDLAKEAEGGPQQSN
jgi:hypothetical protein